MKITVLDGLTENPGDLSWKWLGEYGDYTVYDRTPADKILERCEGCEIVITNKTPLSRDNLSKLDALRYVGLLSTGFNVVDWEYCHERNIPVCNIPTYSTSAVAQLTFAHILELTNAVGLHSQAVHDGEWSSCPDFCFWKSPLTELSGKTIGIIGYGKIGQSVAKIALAMGMKVIASTRTPAEHGEVEFRDLDNLLACSDIVTLHCPLTEKTKGMVNAGFLSKMKKTAFLINTSRGQVINENDLAFALQNGIIAGAGLDVLEKEPPESDNPLFACRNCSITPHIAWAAHETRERLMKICRDNLASFASGKPQNVVY